jgi:hypothetical protein
MSAEKDDELKSFQIGLRSSGAMPKKPPSERYEITKEDYPSLSAANRIKATFKRKTGEKLQELKSSFSTESSEEKERAEKAKRAWELALEVVSQLSVKD